MRLKITKPLLFVVFAAIALSAALVLWKGSPVRKLMPLENPAKAQNDAFIQLWKERDIEAIIYQLPELCRFLDRIGVHETFARFRVERDHYGTTLRIYGMFIRTEKPRIVHDGMIEFLYRERENRPFAANLTLGLNLEELAQNRSADPIQDTLAESGRLLIKDVLNKERSRSELMDIPVVLCKPKNGLRDISFMLPLPIPNFAMRPHYERGYVDKFTTDEAAVAYVMVTKLFKPAAVRILRDLPDYNPPGRLGDQDSPMGHSRGWIVSGGLIIGSVRVSQSCTLGTTDTDMGVEIEAIKNLEPYLRDRATLRAYEEPQYWQERIALPLTLSFSKDLDGRLKSISISYQPETDVLRELPQTSLFKPENAK